MNTYLAVWIPEFESKRELCVAEIKNIGCLSYTDQNEKAAVLYPTEEACLDVVKSDLRQRQPTPNARLGLVKFILTCSDIKEFLFKNTDITRPVSVRLYDYNFQNNQLFYLEELILNPEYRIDEAAQ